MNEEDAEGDFTQFINNIEIAVLPEVNAATENADCPWKQDELGNVYQARALSFLKYC